MVNLKINLLQLHRGRVYFSPVEHFSAFITFVLKVFAWGVFHLRFFSPEGSCSRISLLPNLFQTSECLTTAPAATAAPAFWTRTAPAAADTTVRASATRCSTGRTTTSTRPPTPARTAAFPTATTRRRRREAARGRAPSTDTSPTCRMKWLRVAVLQTEGIFLPSTWITWLIILAFWKHFVNT